MDYTDRLRLLALNDAHMAEKLIGTSCSNAEELDPKTLALVRLAALIAVGGRSRPTAHADAAVNAGASAAEIVAVMVGLVPWSACPAWSPRPPTWPWRWLSTPTRRSSGSRRALRQAPSSPIVVAWRTASLRDETPNLR